jgi:hypothetical protein
MSKNGLKKCIFQPILFVEVLIPGNLKNLFVVELDLRDNVFITITEMV